MQHKKTVGKSEQYDIVLSIKNVLTERYRFTDFHNFQTVNTRYCVGLGLSSVLEKNYTGRVPIKKCQKKWRKSKRGRGDQCRKPKSICAGV